MDFALSPPAFDRCMMESLAALSSSEAARRAAEAWLAAFGAARAAGLDEDTAEAYASQAWRAAAEGAGLPAPAAASPPARAWRRAAMC